MYHIQQSEKAPLYNASETVELNRLKEAKKDDKLFSNLLSCTFAGKRVNSLEHTMPCNNIARCYWYPCTVQVRFINFIPMQFFHKSLHTPLCIPTSAARYLMSKILTITAGIN